MDRNREIHFRGTRLVRIRRSSVTVGPMRVTCYTLTNPFGRKRLIPVQMLETQVRLIAAREGWKVLG